MEFVRKAVSYLSELVWTTITLFASTSAMSASPADSCPLPSPDSYNFRPALDALI
jgi:hypothetical protein